MPRPYAHPSVRLAQLAALGMLPLLLGAGPDYVGCGGGPTPPSTGAPLPEGMVECAIDSDCITDACLDTRCVAGACEVVGPMVDGDGDGDAPPPCGTDCDDTRPDIGGGFVEACDGLDNDCNMLVDDGAARVDRVYPLATGDGTSVIAPWGDRFVITNLTRGAIFGVPVSLGGEIGTPFEIMRLVRGASFTGVVAAAADDGRILFVTRTDDRLIRYVVARPDGDGIEVLAGPDEIEVGLDTVEAMDVIGFGADWALGFEGGLADSRERVIFTDLAGPALVRLDSPMFSRSFAIATDGTHLVMSDAEDGVHFYLPSGMEVTGFTLPGLSLGRRPLSSWRGAVVALTADAFDFNIGFVDSVIGLGSVEPAPFGASIDQVFLHSTTDLVFVSRLGSGGMRVQAIRSDLTTYDGESFLLVDPVSGEAVEGVSVGESSVAIGVGGGGAANGSSLAVLRGCATGAP